MKKHASKIAIVASAITVFYLFNALGVGHYLTLEYLKNQQGAFQTFFQAHPVEVISIYLVIYVISVAVSFPGATVLTLAGGAVFGFWLGTLLVSFASTIGATLAFLVSRYVLRDLVQNKFKERLVQINEGIKKEGAFYLFALRLVPVFPFFLINLAMGLTPIKISTFFFDSQIGMLPGTMAYVYAGTQLAQVTSLNGILSTKFLLAFALIGLLPLASKKVIARLRTKKNLKKFKTPKSFDTNLVVIGAGSAGLVSAYIAAAVRAKVVLIEKHKMGGDCLNTGCVPSKAFIKSAKVLSYTKRAKDFGLRSLSADFDFAQIMERVQKVIGKVAPHDSVARYTGLGVECLQGEARIRTPFEVEVNGRVLTTRNIILATGASPLVPPIAGLDKIKYLTSDNVWALRDLPRRLVILGGGPIGCELAQAFGRFGSQVTQVEMASRIMGREDVEVSEYVKKKFEGEGINVLTEHRAKSILNEDGRKVLICENRAGETRIEFDEILLALGRKANVKGFGLEELGIRITNKGTIEVNEFLQTNYQNIYVCGDVAGPYQFTHTAAHQAWFASVNALFSPIKKFKVDYRVIPWTTFTDPEVARVGLNELEAREKGIAVEVTRYNLDDLDRAITEDEDHGFIKVLTRPGSDRILGVTIVGHSSGEIIAEYVAAMKHGFGLNKILSTIHIYPTFAEANKYAAGVWKKAHAPEKVLAALKKFHDWRRN